LVRRYEHPTGNGWYAVHYDPHRGRFGKTEHAIGDETFASQGEAVKA